MNSDQAPICDTTTCPSGVCPIECDATQTTSEYDLDTNKVSEVEEWVNKLSSADDPEPETEEEPPVPEEASSADPVGSDDEQEAQEQAEADEEEEADESKLFVVMVDSTPVYWAGDRRTAEAVLDRVAQEVVMKYIDTHHVTRDNWTDNVQIYGSKKNSIFNWGAALLHTAALHEVGQCSLV